jgi:hypothetical protein
MDDIIRNVQNKTGPLIKEEAKSWLDSTPAGIEKANVYLAPTLVGLLNKRVINREEARNTIAFFEEEEMKKEWADKPEILLDLFRRGDGAIPEKIKTVYQFMVDEDRPLVLKQLGTTGDINPSHLDKVLSFLCAIIAAQILKNLESESQKGSKLLSTLQAEEEYIKIQTPSKLLELIKRDEAAQESEIEEKSEEDEAEIEKKRLSGRTVLLYTLLLVLSIGTLYWIKSPEFENLSPMIQWHPEKEKQLPDQKIWQINSTTTLTLKQDDPLNEFVNYFSGTQSLDSMRKFQLKSVQAESADTLLPPYYQDALKNLKLLKDSHPDRPFQLSIALTPSAEAIVSQKLLNRMRQRIFAQLPELADGAPYSFLIQINKPKKLLNNRSPDPSQVEVQWTLTLHSIKE